MEASAEAEGLAIMFPPIIRPLSEALGEALDDEEGLAIMFPPIICESLIIVPLGIIC